MRTPRRRTTLDRLEQATGPRPPGVVATPLPVTAPSWSPPTFQNSWADYEAAGTDTPAAYTIAANGLVTIRGLVKKAGAYNPTSVIFTLPAGFRPSKNLVFHQWGSFSGSVTGAARVDVTSKGEVLVYGNVTSADFLSLNLSFYAS